jgi:hypothetical protein
MVAEVAAVTTPATVMVAASELAHCADLAFGSGNEAVKAFGACITMRIGTLLRGETEVYSDSLERLAPYLEFANEVEANSVDEEAEAK